MNYCHVIYSNLPILPSRLSLSPCPYVRREFLGFTCLRGSEWVTPGYLPLCVWYRGYHSKRSIDSSKHDDSLLFALLHDSSLYRDEIGSSRLEFIPLRRGKHHFGWSKELGGVAVVTPPCEGCVIAPSSESESLCQRGLRGKRRQVGKRISKITEFIVGQLIESNIDTLEN